MHKNIKILTLKNINKKIRSYKLFFFFFFILYYKIKNKDKNKIKNYKYKYNILFINNNLICLKKKNQSQKMIGDI